MNTIDRQEIKSLADFKRATQLGSIWRAWHHNPADREQYIDAGIRTVAEKSSVKVGFMCKDNKISYLDYPTADNIEFDDNGDILIFWGAINEPGMQLPRRLVLRYRRLA